MKKIASYSIIAIAILFLIVTYMHERYSYVTFTEQSASIENISSIQNNQPERLFSLPSHYYLFQEAITNKENIQTIEQELHAATSQPFTNDLKDAVDSRDFALTLLTNDVLYIKHVIIDGHAHVVEPHSMTELVNPALSTALDDAYYNSKLTVLSPVQTAVLIVIVVGSFVVGLFTNKNDTRKNAPLLNLAVTLPFILLFSTMAYWYGTFYYPLAIALLSASLIVSEVLYIVVKKEPARWMKVAVAIAAFILVFGIFLYV